MFGEIMLSYSLSPENSNFSPVTTILALWSGLLHTLHKQRHDDVCPCHTDSPCSKSREHHRVTSKGHRSTRWQEESLFPVPSQTSPRWRGWDFHRQCRWPSCRCSHCRPNSLPRCRLLYPSCMSARLFEHDTRRQETPSPFWSRSF